jgi:hypothetical protein
MFHLKAFKNRTLETSIPETAPETFTKGSFWQSIEGKTIPIKRKHKYPGYDMKQVYADEAKSQICPCKARIIIQYGSGFFAFNLKYETVQVHPQAKRANGFILMDMDKCSKIPDECKASIASLPNKIWKQLGSRKDLFIFLLLLEKSTDYPMGILAKDDFTGELYCYRIREIRILEKQK